MYGINVRASLPVQCARQLSSKKTQINKNIDNGKVDFCVVCLRFFRINASGRLRQWWRRQRFDEQRLYMYGHHISVVVPNTPAAVTSVPQISKTNEAKTTAGRFVCCARK